MNPVSGVVEAIHPSPWSQTARRSSLSQLVVSSTSWRCGAWLSPCVATVLQTRSGLSHAATNSCWFHRHYYTTTLLSHAARDCPGFGPPAGAAAGGQRHRGAHARLPRLHRVRHGFPPQSERGNSDVLGVHNDVEDARLWAIERGDGRRSQTCCTSGWRIYRLVGELLPVRQPWCVLCACTSVAVMHDGTRLDGSPHTYTASSGHWRKTNNC